MKLKKCPLCGNDVRFEDGYIKCDCGIKYDVAAAGNKIYAALLWNSRVKSLEEQVYDWLSAIIKTGKPEDSDMAAVVKYMLMTRFTPFEVSSIMVENGQSDKQFKLGETIKYSPSEVKKMLERERESE